MAKRLAQVIFLTMLTALFVTSAALSAEEEGVLEGQNYYQGYYDDDDYGNDWFYDSYGFGDYELGENEARGYFGEEDSNWFGDDEYYSGYYDENDFGNDWWYDSYDDPGDEGFWDV